MRRILWIGVLGLVNGLAEPALGCLGDGMGSSGSSPSTQEPTQASKAPAARVTLSAQVAATPISGRLYLFTTTDRQKIPMRGVSWSQPEPFFGLEVTTMQPGSSIDIQDQADGFPAPLSQLPHGRYRIQAVLDQDIYYPDPSIGPGNLHSQVAEWDWDGTKPPPELLLDQVVPPIELQDTDRIQFVQRKSTLLSDHFGREYIDRAAVILPESYSQQPDRRYPVYYEVTGFGGNLRLMARRGPNRRAENPDEVEFIRVLLTGECKYGHHVYANSAKNGPRGDVLVEEMIPHIDAHFRTIADPKARYVGGHSSGGWSSLWLQVRYPDAFGGCFSSSPDPVDFRDFQGTDLYATPPQSLYVDPQGTRRPLARNGDEVSIWYDRFAKMDYTLKRGGQLKSFEAVFSPLDAKGEPAEAWNWETGYVNPEVIQHWKKYDISLYLQDHWSSLKSKLQGKLHVIMGDKDTFYLEGATYKLAERMRSLGSDAQIEFIPGASHSLPPQARAKLSEAMKQTYLKHYLPNGQPKESR